MQVQPLRIPDVVELRPKKFGDARGFFSETYSQSVMAAHGLPTHWVQDNHSFSAEKHVLRGLHYQSGAAAQDKLVRVIRGKIFDVAVDIRKGSPHFGTWVALVVSADEWNQILIPKGFAHGFLTLEPNTEVIYKVTSLYAPAQEHGIRWDDPDLAIDWPLAGSVPRLSEKDKLAPSFRNHGGGFSIGDMQS